MKTTPEDLKRIYNEFLAAVSEGFCPICRVELREDGFCFGIRGSDTFVPPEDMEPFHHGQGWWHICQKSPPDRPSLVFTHFYFGISFPSARCEDCGLVQTL